MRYWHLISEIVGMVHETRPGINKAFYAKATEVARMVLNTYPELLIDTVSFLKKIKRDIPLPVFEYIDVDRKITAQIFFIKEESPKTLSMLVTVTDDMCVDDLGMDLLNIMLGLIVSNIQSTIDIKFYKLCVVTDLDGFGCIAHGLPLRHVDPVKTYH